MYRIACARIDIMYACRYVCIIYEKKGDGLTYTSNCRNFAAHFVRLGKGVAYQSSTESH